MRGCGQEGAEARLQSLSQQVSTAWLQQELRSYRKQTQYLSSQSFQPFGRPQTSL